MDRKQYNKTYYLKNKERYKKWHHDYYYGNKSKLYGMNRSRHLHRYRTEPEYRKKVIQDRKKYYEEKRDYYIQYGRNYTKKVRKETLEFVGGGNGVQCVRCGFTDERALQIDHVNGGGTKEVRQYKNNRQYLNLIKKNPSKYQILCANCNWIKKVENNECRKPN